MEQPSVPLLVRGLAAGALGTLALSAWEPLRDGLLGHSPPYSVRDIATRALRNTWGIQLAPRAAQRLGLLMRWLYGPALGVLYAGLRPALPPAARRWGLLLGTGVGLLEQLAFPLLRVTTPPRTWTPAEHALLAVQVLLHGFVTEAVLSREDAQGSRRSGTSARIRASRR
ncbi:hypothetical protein F0U62_49125 [Cystobacter fuscus]|uniref:hypothetical protein n=1 Tax=Cystobacter fuscus TaxID=43 RepID=UPI002B31DEF9|nr:hypothetical protein F0U62_49125 [Cystobacter fuscus]